MNKEDLLQLIPIASLFSALGVIFPILFHVVGLGSAFLPMFLPIMMGSLLLPLQLALSISIITPLVSFVFTGMPPLYPPILPVMLVELLVISFLSSYLFYHKQLPFWFVLIFTVLTDRIILFGFVYWLAPFFGLPEKLFSLISILHGIPGIVLILTVIPLTLRFLQEKYPQIINKRI